MNIILRAEKEIDKDEIFKVNQLAFNRNAEANLVNLIRDSDAEYFSCVALFRDKIIAHIMYSTVYIDNVPADWGLHLLLFCLNIKIEALEQNLLSLR